MTSRRKSCTSSLTLSILYDIVRGWGAGGGGEGAYVTDISLMDKNDAKMDKTGHKNRRVQEIEAEGDDKPKREGTYWTLPACFQQAGASRLRF
ncbi:hypothetical protein Tco_0644977 [Tanacetum coccineum]